MTDPTDTSDFARDMAAQARADEADAFNEMHDLERAADRVLAEISAELGEQLAAARRRQEAGGRFDPDDLDDAHEPAPPRDGRTGTDPAREPDYDEPDEEPRRWLT